MMHILLSINRTRTGKLPRDASGATWAAFNDTFRPEALTLTELADTIQAGCAITALHHTRRHGDNFISAQHLGLDFDTEDDSSRLDTLEADDFIGQYAAILHTTSSHRDDAPRARALFLLDRPIIDARQYARYAEALVAHFGQSDGQCKDAARLWFGAPDCEMRTYPDHVLPVAVLDELVAAQEQAKAEAVESERLADIRLDVNADDALSMAVSRAEAGRRNATGFQLALVLRDSGLTQDEARPYLLDYQVAVERLGDHPYTETEALASLKSAYSRKPSGAGSNEIEADLRLMRWLAWHGRLGNKPGDVHTSVAVLFAVAELMEQAGRTQEIELACRLVGQRARIPKSSVMRHLASAVEGGLLLKIRSDGRRANRFSLNREQLRGLARVVDVESAPDFAEAHGELRGLASFQRGARIDVRLLPSEEADFDDDGMGPAMQRALSVLLSGLKNTGTVGTNSRGAGSRLACLSQLCRYSDAVNVSSLSEWSEIAGISSRKLRQVVRTLESLNVITLEFGDDARSKCPSLTDDWYENLLSIQPLLITYGHADLHAVENAKQQRRYHEKRAELTRDDKARYHLAQAAEAGRKLAQAEKAVEAVNAVRRRHCEAHGLEFVPVSLRKQAPRSKPEQAPRVNGRRMGKEKRTKIDVAKLSEFEARRLLAKLAATVNPSEAEKKRAGVLSARLGVSPPEWVRHELNDWR